MRLSFWAYPAGIGRHGSTDHYILWMECVCTSAVMWIAEHASESWIVNQLSLSDVEQSLL